MGAASSAFLAGASRTIEGSYLPAFMLAGLLGVAAAFLSVFIGSADRRAAERPA